MRRDVMSEKLIRALARGGRAVWRAGAWRVVRRSDLRAGPIGSMTSGQVASMMAAGDLSELRPGVLVWSGPQPLAKRSCAAGAPLPKSHARGPKRSRSPLAAVLDTVSDHRQRSVLEAACNRFQSDVERAMAGQRVTQNWDTSLHVDGVRAGDGVSAPALGAVKAQRRLDQIAAAMGEADLRLMTLLLINRRSLAGLAQGHGTTRSGMVAKLVAALRALAQAYRLSVSAPPSSGI